MSLKYFILLTLIISGCGTIETTTYNEKHVVISGSKNLSGCAAIPRIFSGAAYNACSLRAQYASGNYNYFPFYGVDMVLSGGVDILMLPYTLFTQSTQGDIEVKDG